MSLAEVKLDDKYTLKEGRIYLNGTQALVRLALVQARVDKSKGLHTRGFVTGYRGSPLGAIDQAMEQAKSAVQEAGIVFTPGVNEDLAATAILGTQQINIVERAECEGVFALWYGKGPGVDRSGDAFKHGNLAGSAPLGGVLLLLGDDHTCKSSTTSHQSEFGMVDAMIPVVNPAGLGDIIPFGLFGLALSRFSGCWTSMKLVAETMDSSASITIAPDAGHFVKPNFDAPQGGLHIRWPDPPQEQERRLHLHKLRAVHAFARANRIDREEMRGLKKRIGIVTTGKSYLDVRQALELLGIDEARALEIGLSIYKVGLVWPLEPQGIRSFAEGHDTLLVVEEKRPLLEGQIKDLFYDLAPEKRPKIYGKSGPSGALWLPSHDDLTPTRIAGVIGKTILELIADAPISAALSEVETIEQKRQLAKPASVARSMYFCSGCPHSSSTKIPEGSRGMGGIGCHWMSLWMDRSISLYTHMGAEGANWIGQSPFVPTKHVFQNIGDGTYFHSGLLAIRANVAAKTNITYKILFNDAVAMTGGQKHDGPLSPDRIAWQVRAEGVERIAIVTEDLDRHSGVSYPRGTTLHDRDDIDEVQRELREVQGTSALIYDQTCASEKRRRQKRGTLADSPIRAMINEQVCEGCGDCSVKSNCVSVVPLDTEFGTKRRIHQSSCNKDLSCVKGFCPSFVTIEGGVLRKPEGSDLTALLAKPLPDAHQPTLDRPWNIFVAGVGGNGVVTIGAVLAMAAHLERKGCSTLDMIGMAQRGGPVTSHIRVAKSQSDLTAVRIPAQSSDLVLACDVVTVLGAESKALIGKDTTHIVLNSEETITGQFVRNRNARFDVSRLQSELADWSGTHTIETLNAGLIATSLLGDAIGANMIMVGYALQKGLIPISPLALEKAIDLNRVSVEMNKKALQIGRLLALDLKAVDHLLPTAKTVAAFAHRRLSQSLDETITRRVIFLTDYQNAAYGERYRATLSRVIHVEEKVTGSVGPLSEAVAKNLFHLMAIKDEYEVARLYSSASFKAQLNENFSDYRQIKVHLAPPLLAKRDPITGELRKMAFGPWIFKAFPLLAALKFLRGTVFDVFGKTEERRRERQWLADYENLISEVLESLTPINLEEAVALLSIPEEIKGFGHVREKAMALAATHLVQLKAEFYGAAMPVEKKEAFEAIG